MFGNRILRTDVTEVQKGVSLVDLYWIRHWMDSESTCHDRRCRRTEVG